MRTSIWIASQDRDLLNLASRIFGRKCTPIGTSASDIRPGPRPRLILVGCDYQCQFLKCANNFVVALFHLDVPIRMIRLNLLLECQANLGRYLISRLGSPGLDDEANKINELAKFEGIHHRGIFPSDPLSNVIRLQRDILDSRGRAFKVSELKRKNTHSASWQSASFKKTTGMSIKTFANKIRLCHCLWELLSTSKSVKCIALDFGYKPTSFSHRFHKTFGIWPSSVRHRKRMENLLRKTR